MSTLLALHAHPDDESSKGAATVARYADAGVACVLVCATGGEAGDVLNPALASRETEANLPAIRRAELQEAAAIIGYREVIELGYRDSGMPDSHHNGHADAFVNAPLDEVLERLVAIVRKTRPDVVLGYDSHERYPHPDHLKVHAVSTRLVAASADPTQFRDAGPPWRIPHLFAPVFSARRLLLLHEAITSTGGESPFADRVDELRAARDTESELVQVDVTGYIEQGRDALRAHATQIDPHGHWFAVPTEVVEREYPYEDFERIDGTSDHLPAAGELLTV